MGAGRGRGQDWRGRGRGRFGDGRGGGGGRGRGNRLAGRVNAVVGGSEPSPVVKVEMTSEDLERWRQFKESSGETNQPNEAAAASTEYCGAWDWKKAWDREHA